VYPYPHVDKVIPLMAEGKILPYLDIPFQHSHPDVLKRMKRPASGEKNIERINAWREMCPEITLRSTFITGFPGETEQEFEHLLQFIEEAKLDRVGVFTYSAVQGAKANHLPDHVPEELKEERKARLMAVQERISIDKNEAKIGKVIDVLVDETDDEGIVARSMADAPEIDGNVFIPMPESENLRPQIGDMLKVLIDDCDEHDLWATVLDKQ
jgi:ribosomal protein S12 methylthiotransferase